MTSTWHSSAVRPLRTVIAAARAAVLGAAVAVAVLGALTGPPAATGTGVLLGAAVAVATVHLAAWGLESGRPAPRTVALGGTIGALVVPAATGLALLGPAGTGLLTALLLVGPPRPAVADLSPAGAPSPPGAGAGARPR